MAQILVHPRFIERQGVLMVAAMADSIGCVLVQSASRKRLRLVPRQPEAPQDPPPKEAA